MSTLLFAAVCSSPVLAEEDTPMMKEMEKSGKALKAMRKVDPSDWAALAALAKESREAFLRSMSYEASVIEEMLDGKEKQIASADSKRYLGLCYAALCELEIAYLKEDAALVEAAIDSYKSLKSDGHDLYTE
ncbi:hypothetical protein OAB00_00440 [Akkermansiaceae bacterium]|nr:hypothetical protein [Akkermansiaceae bacterium]